ncbi:hypothetical protein MSPP1_004035 [Malassezia sp. CBS 17886]|nr:hypothetical protein MSPP1_004035 [Malassezia sp. CBS 17886]
MRLPTLAVACIAAAAAAAAATHAANPFATREQRAIDANTTSLYRDTALDSARRDAHAQYLHTLKKYQVAITAQVQEDVREAIDELAFMCVQRAVNNDPASPKLSWGDTAPRPRAAHTPAVPGSRYSYDNPDCFYGIVPISSKYTYRLRGRRTGDGPADVSFSLISNPASQNTVAALYGRDLRVEDDGSYTVTISSAPRGDANHIQSSGNVVQLFIRNDLGDWKSERPDELSVERVGDPPVHKERASAAVLQDAVTNLKEATFFYGFGALDFKTFSVATNTLSSPSQSLSLGTLTSQASSFGHFDLRDNEALVVTMRPGHSTYWVVPVYTVGMITVNPGARQVSLNNRQSAANGDGSYTFVVSKEDPLVHNWLDTAGRAQGTMMVRWQGLPSSGDGARGISIDAKVVKLAALRGALPAGTKYLSKRERDHQLKQRKTYYDRLH